MSSSSVRLGMNDSTKTVVNVVGTLVVLYIAWKLFLFTVGIVKFLIPLALIGGVVYVVYRASGSKALGGGRRTLP